jgi:hypothetical protein
MPPGEVRDRGEKISRLYCTVAFRIWASAVLICAIKARRLARSSWSSRETIKVPSLKESPSMPAR